MKKTILLFMLLSFFAVSQAQISTRENDATVFKLGARPTMGDMALTFALPINSDSDLPSFNLLGKGDLLTGKKFIKDDLAIRAGIRLYKNSSKSEGDVDTSVTGGSILSAEYQESSREYNIVPGIEKHFSNSNFFDVYAGGDLYLGFGKDKSINNETYVGSEFDEMTSTTSRTIVGLGGIIGINMFVVDLPISIGLEYGWTAKWNFGGKTHVERSTKVGGTTTNQDYYTQDTDPFGNPDTNAYSDLKKSAFEMDTNQQVRIALNFYFN